MDHDANINQIREQMHSALDEILDTVSAGQVPDELRLVVRGDQVLSSLMVRLRRQARQVRSSGGEFRSRIAATN